MFKLLRYFSITSLIAIVVVTIFLTFFYQHIATQNLVIQEEQNNVQLAQSLINTLQPQLYKMFFSEEHPDKIHQQHIEKFNHLVSDYTQDLSIVKVKAYHLNGLTVFSTQASQIGKVKINNQGDKEAGAGRVFSSLSYRGEFYASEETLTDRNILSTYLPVRQGGEESPVKGVFEVYSDVTPLVTAIQETKHKIALGIVTALGLLYITLFFIVSRADSILRRQEDEHLEAEQALRESEARFSGILDMATEGIISVDETRHIILFNKGAELIFGFQESEIVGRPLEDLLPKKYRQRHEGQFQAFAQSPETARQMGSRSQVLGLRKNGEFFAAEVSISKLNSGGQCIFTAVLRDVSERKIAEKHLQHQAIHDSLTGLYNRGYFDRRITEEIARSKRNRQAMSILLCDLDGFKNINDASGHQVGDRVLKEVAQGIQAASRESDLVFRWGGDEFVLILPSTDRQGATTASERIREGILQVSEQHHVKVDVSIGAAVYPEHGKTIDELIHVADRAMYTAKKWGSKSLIGEESYLLNEQTIKTVFQPIHDIRLDQIVGYEALVRDAQGQLDPMNLFKKYAAIGKLLELKELCFRTQLKTAAEVGLKKVFLNVDFELLQRLERVAIPTEELEVVLEISEAEALHDIPKHLEIAKAWREAGYQFAIDDFGAGFVSLAFIARLLPEHIKLDRSVIVQATASPPFIRILKDLMVGLKNCSTAGIVAEGVETAQELQTVKKLGLFLGQGFLLGKPEEIRKKL